MMIGSRGRAAKAAVDPFRPPPWTRATPTWRQLDEQLPPDHLARLIDRGVDQLDLTPLLQSYSGRGSKALRPDLMLKIALFEIQRGRRSPAQWYLDTKENVALQWLGLGLQPARCVWYTFAFRVRHTLEAWNRQVLQQAQAHGWLQGTRVSLDGTLVEANASRHRLLNRVQLQQRRGVLAAAVQADAEGTAAVQAGAADTAAVQADAADTAAVQANAADTAAAPRPYWMAHTAPTRRRQQDQYERAQAKLDERWADNQQRVPSKRLDQKHVRISVTDPEAPLGLDKLKVFRPLYNVQFVRDLDSPFLLGYETFARSSDTGTLVPMLRRTQQLTGQLPKEALVDSGYITALDLADAQRVGVTLYGPWKENDYSDKKVSVAKQLSKEAFAWDAQARHYRCPEGQTLQLTGVQKRPRSLGRTERLEIYRANAATCAACPLKARCCPRAQSGRSVTRSEHEELIEAHRRHMATPPAKELYKRRAQTVEPSFGDAKQHRNYRRVNGRGLWKAQVQTALTVLAHNLKEFAKRLLGAGPPEEKT